MITLRMDSTENAWLRKAVPNCGKLVLDTYIREALGKFGQTQEDNSDDVADEAFIVFDDFCTKIGKSHLWPRNIRKLFWSKNLSLRACFILIAFCVVNGITEK